MTQLWKCKLGMTSSSIGEVKQRHAFKMRQGKGKKTQPQEMGEQAQSWNLFPESYLRHSVDSFKPSNCRSEETQGGEQQDSYLCTPAFRS